MLSNNIFLETRIQRLLDGLIFVEKGLSVLVMRMVKMRRVYTLAEILNKIFVKKKNKGKLGTRFTKWFDKLTILCHLILYLNILCDHCLHDLHCTPLHLSINCVTTGARKMPIEYMFCCICSEQCIKIILCGLFSYVFKKIIPDNITTFSRSGWGNLTPHILSMA